MKNTLYTIITLLMINSVVLGVELDFNAIDLAKISNNTKDFAMSLSDSSVDAIKKGAEAKLSILPNEILGVKILELKDNVINADIAAKINQEIQKAYTTLQNIKPFINDPKTGLMLIQTLYQVMSAQIPQSIKNLFVDILALAKKIIDSKDEKDIAGVNALRNIISTGNNIIETLYNNRNNLATLGSGGMPITITDIEAFKGSVKNNVGAIKELIERNGKELQEIFAKARAISPADLASFKQTFETGLATAKSLLG